MNDRSINIREFVGVQENEADVGEGAGFARDGGGVDVGDEIGVGVEGFAEGEIFAGLFLDGFAEDFQRRSGERVGFPGDEIFDLLPMVAAGLRFLRGGGAVQGKGEGADDGRLVGVRFLDGADGEGGGAGVDGLAVEESENLRGDGGGVPAFAEAS